MYRPYHLSKLHYHLLIFYVSAFFFAAVGGVTVLSILLLAAIGCRCVKTLKSTVSKNSSLYNEVSDLRIKKFLFRKRFRKRTGEK